MSDMTRQSKWPLHWGDGPLFQTVIWDSGIPCPIGPSYFLDLCLLFRESHGVCIPGPKKWPKMSFQEDTDLSEAVDGACRCGFSCTNSSSGKESDSRLEPDARSKDGHPVNWKPFFVLLLGPKNSSSGPAFKFKIFYGISWILNRKVFLLLWVLVSSLEEWRGLMCAVFLSWLTQQKW